MTVVLFNHFHAGDIVMSRTIAYEIIRANPGRSFELQCRHRYAYLWQDLGAPVVPLEDGQERVERGEPSINLWFGTIDGMLVKGLTYANQVETYNLQAPKAGLTPIVYDGKQRFVNLPVHRPIQAARFGVIIENGPVLSGQPVLDIDPHLQSLANHFPHATFYCSSPPPPGIKPPQRGRFFRGQQSKNIVDVSNWNLCDLSALSNQCVTMIARLSAILVCSFTERNHGRKRIVFGTPLGCPIWDEAGLVYVQSYDALRRELEPMLQ